MDSKAIARLFDRFSIIWGAKWDKQVEKNPELLADEWSEALAGQSRQAIQQGLSKARMTLAWPPTIAEFLQLCQGAPNDAPNENRHLCAIGGCPNDGTMSRSTHGSNWVCNLHYAQGKG